MKHTQVFLAVALITAGIWTASGSVVYAVDYGDFRSETLVRKAWQALNQDDLAAVLSYTNKVLELYAGEAAKMQAQLSDYPTGEPQEIFKNYWALNDVATALFIQGEAYRKAGDIENAKKAYQRLIKEFKYGLCWDPKGWFWKPAQAAKEKLAMLETGSNIDLSDTSSQALVAKAWQALADRDLDAVLAYTNKVIELYADIAKEQQKSLSEYPFQKDEIFKYWALNDVGTALFIKGEALRRAGKIKEAKKAYKTLIETYYFAQCWDPQGWFWKPAEAAQEKLDNLGS